ncbi:ABC transporter ATP-binding protein [Alicyclobacillus tolerans]|uniref:ABC-type polysaccharide/polyol phosphate transport system ATPase subunit n=1 Tax=Alicyclobacillus tolerans TaxID=90970 RepID=A0ABT9LV27_9BACL|nr:ABC transporter ATP-binding protein [Alicyclobacillus tengchongensis]MDP9728094.1 ABC-type polysaccharide/polyol phosphate transport system ATPase subunit [Alicyclobacillus tengchongensis]
MAQVDYAIRVKNVTKKFKIYGERNQTLKEKLLYAGRAKHKEFIALDNVSLDIERGTTIGLIGVNGSGKSTLLKIISRILYPDTGAVEVNGRVSSLLELGAGFHPEFTGLENIFLNGSLMGLSKKELSKRVDEIIEFSELGDFIYEPIRGYSSGMYMRLAFSIATLIEPDILLLDEVLAVGDAAFQAKCMRKMEELKNKNRTIVLVSHDSNAVRRICDSAVLLNKSKIIEKGSCELVINRYSLVMFQ